MLEDEEILKMYAEESLEHLSTIENDLLKMEESGGDIDEDLVNKVFRAAHSIKGGAGYMGLSNINDLSHNIENALDRIRRRELLPNSQIISILLRCFDRLRELINSIEKSNGMDIKEYIDTLSAYTTIVTPGDQKEASQEMADISVPGGKVVMTVPWYDILRVRKESKYLYLVQHTMSMSDYQKKIGKTILQMMPLLMTTGYVIDTKVDFSSIGTLEEELPDRIPFWILFATIIDPDIGLSMFEIDDKNVFVITEDLISRIQPELQKGQTDPPDVSQGEPGFPGKKEALPVNSPAEKKSLEPVMPLGELDSSSVDANEHSPKLDPEGQASLRVNVSLLDTLMNLAGELVLCRNQLIQASASKNSAAQENAQQRIDIVTSELQEAIMRTRLQPISKVFNKFPRIVRDVSKRLGKEIELIIEGKEVELDKTIIEAISDPLTHIVRNAVDHGIETHEVRKKLGKEAKGRLFLKAFHEAGQVNINITDDGKGIDGGKIANAAFEKGLITEQQNRNLSEKEKTALIFLPGFSTAENVTEVSGRGVGMDVVKTNLDKIGGIVEIESIVGQGSTIRIKIPLTLAIIPSQIVYAGEERYAIPQVNLDELLIISADQVKNRVEKIGNAEVVRLRDSLLPLIHIADVLEIEKQYTDPGDEKEHPDRRQEIADRRSKHWVLPVACPAAGDGAGQDDIGTLKDKTAATSEISDFKIRHRADRRYRAASDIKVAVVSAGTYKYGLVVQKLGDSEEIVVKPIGRHLKGCKEYAGATIMGDGKVALILDIAGLAQAGNITAATETQKIRERVESAGTDFGKKENVSLLLFKNAEDEQFAVPMNLVERIESIDGKAIKKVGGEKVVQYRGGVLPLFRLDDVARIKSAPEGDHFEVIVFKVARKTIGLIVTPPVDGVEVPLEVDHSSFVQPGIMGSTIINHHITLMVDIFGAVKTLKPEWYEELDYKKHTPDKRSTILFAEDSAFFRNQVKGYIEDDGYTVLEAEDGRIAWDLLEKHMDEIRVVVTDLAMPVMNGFELTKKIKDDERFSHLPVIALTSLASDTDMSEGKEAGIDDYQIKLDREKLLNSLEKFSKRQM